MDLGGVASHQESGVNEPYAIAVATFTSICENADRLEQCS